MRAWCGERIHRAATDERFRLAFADVHPRQKILQRRIGLVPPVLEDGVDGVAAQMLHLHQTDTHSATFLRMGSVRNDVTLSPSKGDRTMCCRRNKPVFTFIDIRQQKGETQPPRLLDVGAGVVKPTLIRQYRRHEFRRVVRLQPGGLVRDQRERGAVRLAEGVARETLHLPPQLLRDLGRHPVCQRAGDEPLPVVFHRLPVALLAHAFPQPLGFAQRHAGDGVGDLDHVFLIDHDAEGLIQNRLQLRMQIADGLPAVMAVDERLHHAAVGDAGTDDGARRRQHLEGFHAQLLQQVAHARRLDVETADGPPRLHQRAGFGIGHGVNPHDVWFKCTLSSSGRGDSLPLFKGGWGDLVCATVEIDRHTIVGLHVLDRVRQHRQALLCQQVDLQQSHVLHRVHVVLRHGEPLRRLLQWDEIGDRERTDDDAAAVDGQMAREPLDAAAQCDDRPVRLVLHRQIAAFRHRLPHRFQFRHAGEMRQGFGKRVDFGYRYAQRLAHFANQRAAPKMHMGGDQRHVLVPVSVKHVIQYFVASVPGEVDVNIRIV